MSAQKSFLFLVLSIIIGNAPAQVNLDSGLVACFPFNGNGSDVIGSRSGTLTSISPTPNRFNTPNSAIVFNCGAGSQIQLPDDPLLKPQALSFSAWIRPTTSFVSKGYLLYAAWNGTSAPAYAITLENTSGGKILRLTRTLSSGSVSLQCPAVLTNNNWSHIGISMDNSSMFIYLNGVFQASLAAAGTFSYAQAQHVYLGSCNLPGNTELFCGSLDNTRFYDRVLTSQEVGQLFTNDPACVTATAAPVASFSVSPPVCVNQPFQLKDLSSGYPDNYLWQLNSGSISNPFDANPICTFTSAGVYTATLTVTNSLGTSSVSSIFTVNPTPNVIAATNRTYTCRDWGAELTGIGASTYTWSNAIVAPSVQVYPTVNTSYTVTGTDSLGCIGTGSVLIRVSLHCPIYINGTIEGLAGYEFSVYPTITQGFVSVDAHSSFEYKLLNQRGVEVLIGSCTDPPLQLNLGPLPAGIYILRLSDGEKSKIFKLIKN